MFKTKAIILKITDLGEVDQFLTIYSKNFGKIKVAARGAKKLQSKLRHHLQPINLSGFILVQGKNYKIVKDAILINQFLNIKKDLNKIKIAHKIINLADELIAGEEADEQIWELLLKSLETLNQNNPGSDFFKKFKNSLVEILGYSPEHTNIEDIY